VSGRRTSLRETLRLSGSFIEGNRRTLTLVVIAAVLSGFAEAVALVLIARLAFGLVNGRDDVALGVGDLFDGRVGIETLIALAAGLVVVDVALQVGGAALRSRLGARVARKYRGRLIDSHLHASWSLQAGERSGRLQEMVSVYTAEAATTVTQLASSLVALATLLAFLVTALVVNVAAAVAVAVAAFGLGLILFPLRQASRRVSRRANAANLTVSTDVAEATAHLQEIRTFGVEDAVARRFDGRVREAAALDARKAFLNSLAPVVYQGTALLLIVAAAATLYLADVTHLGGIGGVMLIMLRSLTYAQSLQANYQGLSSATPALEALQAEIQRYEAAKVDRGGARIGRIGDLEFDAVSFEYQTGSPVLRDVSFTVPQGDIVGIVGPSGAGKSTLVQLVLRFRDPSRGRVIADGRDVRGLALDDWYERVSFVPQEPALFAGSVADNIRFYRDDVDDTAIERAARLANLHDDIVAMPSGYDTPVGERGGDLSGGQRQRLCIARALVEAPDLIVFDESTSALDGRSESLVRSSMQQLAPAATVFVIAHRLSTLSICNRIMVLLDGELHGFDEPQRLEETNPFYREALMLSGLR
jgi:ATP-binding cassette, subfamily B, bacterial